MANLVKILTFRHFRLIRAALEDNEINEISEEKNQEKLISLTQPASTSNSQPKSIKSMTTL